MRLLKLQLNKSISLSIKNSFACKIFFLLSLTPQCLTHTQLFHKLQRVFNRKEKLKLSETGKFVFKEQTQD